MDAVQPVRRTYRGRLRGESRGESPASGMSPENDFTGARMCRRGRFPMRNPARGVGVLPAEGLQDASAERAVAAAAKKGGDRTDCRRPRLRSSRTAAGSVEPGVKVFGLREASAKASGARPLWRRGEPRTDTASTSRCRLCASARALERACGGGPGRWAIAFGDVGADGPRRGGTPGSPSARGRATT